MLIISYWLCGVNFKTMVLWIKERWFYIILTLWSQLQNSKPPTALSKTHISYWLCGVNFKTGFAPGDGAPDLYHIDSVESTSKLNPSLTNPPCSYIILTLWSQLQNAQTSATRAAAIYHIDSVESTSKPFSASTPPNCRYIILTLWSQLQNGEALEALGTQAISYWLCGVNRNASKIKSPKGG